MHLGEFEDLVNNTQHTFRLFVVVPQFRHVSKLVRYEDSESSAEVVT